MAQLRPATIQAAAARGCKDVSEYLEAKRRACLQLEIDLLTAKLTIRNAQRRMIAGKLAYKAQVPYSSLDSLLRCTPRNLNVPLMLDVIKIGKQLLEQDARGELQ